ncbi:T9SS type A sorting domain-containing protein [Hymenobacter sp. BT188]|uniref:T9SS type A sorting domain-containing protein n=1 Tax=Hymenobacter sp. BT188 TaxID=2763504 RepID=UPI0016510267|nr:T9SS type A sorting domain-containing protein [Hymenobacter sp. BT188]MBC6607576.1 T9SS type A sorting domain-containing protein [Hymenobacter sp. BT188]
MTPISLLHTPDCPPTSALFPSCQPPAVLKANARSASNGLTWLGRVALLWILSVGLSFQSAVAQDPGIGGTQAGFEIDADFKSGFIPSFWKGTAPNQTYFPSIIYGDDWSRGPSGNPVLLQQGGISILGVTADGRSIWQVDGNWGTASTIGELSVFAGQSNKNGDAIGTGPAVDPKVTQKPYAVGTGSGGPQKNDITNTFLHSREIGGKLWLFFAAETRSVNGASYLDFEYNQAGAKVIGNQLVGQGLVNGRTVGDFLLVVNYTGGGNKPVIGVRTWLASGTWSAERSVSTLGAFITTNTANVDAVAPNKSFTTEGAPSSTSGALQMVEGGINITDVEGLDDLNQCTPLATITVKTRSSPSYTSELKDFDILKFALTPSAAAEVAAVDPQCKAASGPTVFNVTGSYSNGTATWSVSAGGILSNESTANGVASATVSVAGDGPVTVTLTTASVNAACPPFSDSETLTINPLPTVTAADKSVCIGGSVALTGTPVTGGTWSGTGVSGSIFNSTGLAAGEYTVTYSFTNANNCTNTATAKVTVNALPTVMAADKSVCIGGSVALTGTPATGGTWSGTGVSGSIFNSAGLAAGEYMVTYSFTDAGTTCTNTATAKVTVNPLPTAAISGGVFCKAGTTQLTVTSGTTGGTFSSSPAGLSMGSSGLIDLAASTVGTYTITYSFSDANTCTNTTTSSVTVDDLPGPPAVTVIQPSCDRMLGSVTVTSPVGDNVEYSNQGGTYQKSPTFSFAAGQGYSIVARTVGTVCVSGAATCTPDPDYVSVRAVSSSQQLAKTAPAPEKSIQTEVYPNPTGRDATINFRVPSSGRVEVRVYNAMGVEVATLFNGEAQAGENRSVVFKGSSLPSGTYYYRVTTNGKTKTNRISLAK